MNSSLLETNQKIPKLIWQTAKSTPHKQSKLLIKSWIEKNPDYKWLFMDDQRCNQFIRENFNNEFYQMFISLPFGVMRADVWRAAVLYAYGGVYVDTDCQCIVPIKTWLNPDDELIIGVETERGELLNYAFASVPRHPALLSVLNRFVELSNEPTFLSKENTTPIQNFGQYGFSDGILRHYQCNDPEQMKLGAETNYYNEINKVKEEHTKFMLYHENRFSGRSENNYIAHHTASMFWGSTYDSWRRQESDYLNETN